MNRYLAITLIYFAATLTGMFTYMLCAAHMDTLWALFTADAAATILTWGFGLALKNVSIYDPYWSVAPPVLLSLYAIVEDNADTACLVMLSCIWIWALRLTLNWAETFKALRDEDWRYTKYRTQCHPVIFQTINFFGLNMMPTVVVFLAMIPAIRIIQNPTAVTWFSILGAIMSLSAVAIQYSADTTAHRFRKENPGKVCREGLWKNGRHPNYFGEILMWWGIWVQSLPSGADWSILGAVATTLLFLGISIPLMESRQLRNKPEYAQYRKQTRILI